MRIVLELLISRTQVRALLQISTTIFAFRRFCRLQRIIWNGYDIGGGGVRELLDVNRSRESVQ